MKCLAALFHTFGDNLRHDLAHNRSYVEMHAKCLNTIQKQTCCIGGCNKMSHCRAAYIHYTGDECDEQQEGQNQCKGELAQFLAGF